MIGLLTSSKWRIPEFLNIYPDKQWGWTYALYSGIIAILWIIVQQLMTEYFILQPVILSLGILIVILCLLPGIMNYFSRKIKARNN
jgi:hypothetical protein